MKSFNNINFAFLLKDTFHNVVFLASWTLHYWGPPATPILRIVSLIKLTEGDDCVSYDVATSGSVRIRVNSLAQ